MGTIQSTAVQSLSTTSSRQTLMGPILCLVRTPSPHTMMAMMVLLKLTKLDLLEYGETTLMEHHPSNTAHKPQSMFAPSVVCVIMTLACARALMVTPDSGVTRGHPPETTKHVERILTYQNIQAVWI